MKKIILVIIFLSMTFIYSVAIEYTVIKGDCLWNIAKKFYENPFLWKKIYESNKDKIKNPDLIYPGQIFLLPDIENFEQQSENIAIETQNKENQELETKKEEVDKSVQENIHYATTQTKDSFPESFSETGEEKTKFLSEPKYEGNLEFVKKYNLKEFVSFGKIVSAKERKFFYIDFDIVYCKINKEQEIKVGDILGIYHLGPSKYDTTLLNVPKNQLTLVGKMQILEINKDIAVCKIIRTYSPILIGDMASGFKK